MTRCKFSKKEPVIQYGESHETLAIVVIPMTITTLAGVCHFDAERCFVVHCNLLGYVDAIPSPFARSPSTVFIRPRIGPVSSTIRVLCNIPCQGHLHCLFSLTHLIA